MKRNLMENLKEYFIKVKQEDSTFNLIEYYELIKQNQESLEEMLIHSKLTEYDLSYTVPDEYTCVIGIAFKYEEEIITYNLTFGSYGGSNGLNVIKYYDIGTFNLLDNEITKDVYVEWEETLKIFKLQEKQKEIELKKEYILEEQRRLRKLEDEMNKLTL